MKHEKLYHIKKYDTDHVARQVYQFITTDDIDDAYLENYMINGDETLYHISDKKYNTPEYWWLLCFVNGIKDLFNFDVPLSHLSIYNSVVKDLGFFDDQLYRERLATNEVSRSIKIVKPGFEKYVASQINKIMDH